MKNLKKVLAVLLSACFVLSFAACSGDSGNSTPADDDKSSEESKNEGGDGDSDEYDYYSDYAQDISGDIEFYQQKPEIEEYMYEVIDDFNAVYPNITVTQNVQNDAASNLQTRAASGDFTDIWLYWPTDMVWQSFYDEGLLMDVTDQPYIKTAAESVEALFERDGKYYGVPEANNAAGIIANVGMFEDNGIALPEDWDSFIAACDAFVEKGIVPIGLTLKDGADCARNILLGDYVPGDEVKAVARGEKKLSETDFPKSVDDLTKIYSYATDKAISSDYNTGLTDFANEESAMFISGNWTFASIRGINPDIKIDVRYTNDYVDTAIAKEYGLSMINDNKCDIIWGVAGNSGNGAAEAAYETGKAYFLGVDSDQELTLSSDLAAITLTSGLKNIGNSLIWFFDELDAGRTYFGQEVSLGLAEGGVGIVTDKNFATYASDDLKAAISAAEEAIKNGELTVDSALAEGGPDLAVQLRTEVQP